MANYKKYAKKLVKKAGRAIKRRYFKGKGYSNPNIGQMASDVMMLKKLVNAEKKHTTLSGNALSVGQFSGNVAGYYGLEITPTPSAGVSEIQRNGTSIKLVSSFMKFQFVAQSALVNRTRLKVMIIQTSGQYISSINAWIADRFKANPFITGGSIIDYNSAWNTNTYGGFRVIRTKYITLQPDANSGETNIQTVNLGIKYNKGKGTHIRYQSGTNTPANTQLFMIVMADTGNANSVTATSGFTGIAQTAVNTGVNWQYYATHYYIDN